MESRLRKPLVSTQNSRLPAPASRLKPPSSFNNVTLNNAPPTSKRSRSPEEAPSAKRQRFSGGDKSGTGPAPKQSALKPSNSTGSLNSSTRKLQSNRSGGNLRTGSAVKPPVSRPAIGKPTKPVACESLETSTDGESFSGYEQDLDDTFIDRDVERPVSIRPRQTSGKVGQSPNGLHIRGEQHVKTQSASNEVDETNQKECVDVVQDGEEEQRLIDRVLFSDMEESCWETDKQNKKVDQSVVSNVRAQASTSLNEDKGSAISCTVISCSRGVINSYGNKRETSLMNMAKLRTTGSMIPQPSTRLYTGTVAMTPAPVKRLKSKISRRQSNERPAKIVKQVPSRQIGVTDTTDEDVSDKETKIDDKDQNEAMSSIRKDNRGDRGLRSQLDNNNEKSDGKISTSESCTESAKSLKEFEDSEPECVQQEMRTVEVDGWVDKEMMDEPEETVKQDTEHIETRVFEILEQQVACSENLSSRARQGVCMLSHEEENGNKHDNIRCETPEQTVTASKEGATRTKSKSGIPVCNANKLSFSRFSAQGNISSRPNHELRGPRKQPTMIKSSSYSPERSCIFSGRRFVDNSRNMPTHGNPRRQVESVLSVHETRTSQLRQQKFAHTDASSSTVGKRLDQSLSNSAIVRFNNSSQPDVTVKRSLPKAPSQVRTVKVGQRVVMNNKMKDATIDKELKVGAGRPPSASKTATKAPASAPNPGTAGKSKRPAWDLKGRLQDMENQLKREEAERNKFVEQMQEWQNKHSNLENKNVELSSTVAEKEQNYLSTVSQNASLRANLQETENELYTLRKQFERDTENFEFTKASLRRQKEALEGEISGLQQEVTGYKTSVAQLTSSQAGLKSELDATKIALEQATATLREQEAEIAANKATIAEQNSLLINHETVRRQLHNTIQELKGNIRVFCRVRPLIGEELFGNNGEINHMGFPDPDQTVIELERLSEVSLSESTLGGNRKGSGKYEFSFDKVFTPGSTQKDVFEEISQLVQSALDGYNVCIFAYGQTGSGKTYTMEGPSSIDEESQGMISRALLQIFHNTQQLHDKGWQYEFEASFLEIYNETIRDLLSNQTNVKHEIKQAGASDVTVTNLTTVTVTNENQITNLLKTASKNRAVGETQCNERSSRSHSVFRLKITGANSITGEDCKGTLNLVDLAGSERLKESGATGQRLKETQSINKSLSNLGNVIMALGNKENHIPYRNSKLTYLLQNSLGGNSKTLMFVNVSPREENFSETLNSLRFATKVNQCNIGTATKKTR